MTPSFDWASRTSFPVLDLPFIEGVPSPEKAKAMTKLVKDNSKLYKHSYVKMYHATDARLRILDDGLKPTSASRRRSYQSESGYVYLANTPERAKNFGDSGNGGKSVVYEVLVPVRKLLPDKDQLANQLAVGNELGNSIGESIVYGGGARHMGKIEPWAIREYVFEKSKTFDEFDIGAHEYGEYEKPLKVAQAVFEGKNNRLPYILNENLMTNSNENLVLPENLFDIYVTRVKKEIIADVLAGHVPVTCGSFAELDGYRDANVYGGFGDDDFVRQMANHFGGRDVKDDLPVAVSEFITKVQFATDEWLKSGGLAIGCPPPGWKVFDAGVDWLNRSGDRPFNSVFEKQVGGNGYPTCDLTVLSDGRDYCAAHGDILMPGRVGSALEAANMAMSWAAENGWSNDELNRKIVPGGKVPIPAFSPFLDHKSYAAAVTHEALLEAAPNLVGNGTWSGKVLDVSDGLVIQKINRAGETVQHDLAKLSELVKAGDLVDIVYRGGIGVVGGLGVEPKGR